MGTQRRWPPVPKERSLRPQPPGLWGINLSFKPPACGSFLWGPSEHSGHPKPGLGSHRAASEARQQRTHALACLGAALRSLPCTRCSSTFSAVLRFTQGPAGHSRLRSKPKPERPPCHRVYGLAWASQGLQTGETAARLPPPQCCDFIRVLSGALSP